jgi:nicotinate-nucleotide pyrophosphorylase (carboxylating)
MNWDSEEIQSIIDRALQEDIGTGDITTDTMVPGVQKAAAVFMAKQPGVLAGLPLISRVFRRLDPQLQTEELLPDGGRFVQGAVLCRIQGSARAVLSGERVALNFLQRMCGIATQTAFYADQARAHGIAVLDTRKTTPLLRILEKYAVHAGGGANHRMGLYDGVMVKDNHLQIDANFKRILDRFQSRGISPEQVEVEVVNPDMLKKAVEAGVRWFLLDNMTPAQIKQCIRIKHSEMKFEVSGGVTAENFSDYLIPGIDAISIGALTHSVRSVDISMEIV